MSGIGGSGSSPAPSTRCPRPVVLLSHPSRTVPALRSAIPTWLDQWEFTRFVTLATNDPTAADARLPGSNLKHSFMRERLRKWDAHMNHAILGREWADRHADRLWAFYFLENPNSNPHWHGLVRFFTSDEEERERQEQIFDESAEPIWKKLMPSGTVKVLDIYGQRGVAEYVAKQTAYPLSYEYYVTPDELKNG
jgi:hypothetical protein